MAQRTFSYHLSNGKTMDLEGDEPPSDAEVEALAKQNGVQLQVADKPEPSPQQVEEALHPTEKPLNVERSTGPANPSAERRHQEDYNSRWGNPNSSVPITDPISKRGRDFLDKPLTDAPSRFGKAVSKYIDPEQTGIQGGVLDTLKNPRAAASTFIESVMGMATNATSPKEIITNLLTAGTTAKLLQGGKKAALGKIADDAANIHGPVQEPPVNMKLDPNLQGGMGDPISSEPVRGQLGNIADEVVNKRPYGPPEQPYGPEPQSYGPEPKPFYKLQDGKMQQVERPVVNELEEMTTAPEPEVAPDTTGVDFESPAPQQQLPESWNILAQKPKSPQQILNEAAIMKRRAMIAARNGQPIETINPQFRSPKPKAPVTGTPPGEVTPPPPTPEVPPNVKNQAAPRQGPIAPLTPPDTPKPLAAPKAPPVKPPVPTQQIPGAILTNNKKAQVAMMSKPHEKESKLRMALDFNRTLLTAYDMSAPLRQGLGMITHKEFWTSLDDMFKSVGSKRGFDTVMKSIEDDPSGYFKRGMSGAGVPLPSYAEKVGLAVHDIPEEIFRGAGGRAAEKWLPGVKQSNRAYNGYIAKLRADGFKRLVKEATAAGKDPENDIVLGKKIADFINTATGRGDLGKLEPVVKQLSDVFFAPKLMASRLQTYNNALNPWKLGILGEKVDPMLRREALRSLFGVVTTGGLISGMAKKAGADVTLDPRSTDFMKIKIGNSRFDPFGGYQQYAVNTAKFISGQSVSSKNPDNMTDLTAGKYGQDTRQDIASRFFTNKLAPVPSLIWSWMGGKEFDGTPFEAKKAILTRTVPIFMQDMAELLQEDPNMVPAHIKALFTTGSFFGGGIQTYGR